MKEIKVILSKEAEEVYKYLLEQSKTSKLERSIFNAVTKKIEFIKSDFHYGEPVAKNLIPKEYIAKYGIANLFRVELPNFWRLLYTLVDGKTKIEIVAFVLDFIDHNEYNKKFGYRKN